MVRVLTTDDADAFRVLRLEALRDSPNAFAASLEDEARFTRGDFLRRIEPTEQSWILGAFLEANLLVGCMGWYRELGAKVSHKSHLWGMFVTPAHRRNGIARALVNEVLTRAKLVSGIRQIELFVASNNEAAAHLYKSTGFERVGVHPQSLLVGEHYIDEELYVLWLR